MLDFICKMTEGFNHPNYNRKFDNSLNLLTHLIATFKYHYYIETVGEPGHSFESFNSSMQKTKYFTTVNEIYKNLMQKNAFFPSSELRVATFYKEIVNIMSQVDKYAFDYWIHKEFIESPMPLYCACKVCKI